MSPLSMALLGTGLIATFACQRDRAMVPLIALLCIIPYSHRISLATLDFPITRIMLLALFVRALARAERPTVPFMPAEKLVIAFIVVFGGISSISGGAWVAEAGKMMTLLLLAYSVRIYLNRAQLYAAITAVGLISLPTAALFWYEHTTAENLYHVLGGVSDRATIRFGEVRARGPFFHPIYAGVYWVTFCSFFIWRALIAPTALRKAYWALCIAASLVIAMSTSSSTPIMGFAAIAMCWGAYFVRQLRGWFIPATVGLLIALDLVMKAPVWHLIARVGSVEGSTSYFRFKIIDAFFQNIGEWFFLGTRSTGHWFWGAQDIVNQFVYYGVRGGILSLVLFILVVSRPIRILSQSFDAFDHARDPERFLVWCFLASISSTLIMFIGVSYFDQIAIQLYLIIFGGLAYARTIQLQLMSRPATDQPAVKPPVGHPQGVAH